MFTYRPNSRHVHPTTSLYIRPRCSSQLPVRPRPYEGESGESYLTRLAWANGYDSLTALARLVRSRLTPARFRAWLHLSEVESSKLEAPWPRYSRVVSDNFPKASEGLAICYAFTRWCPACLQAAPFLRGCWSIKLNCMCMEHCCLLEDECPGCRSHLRIGQVLSRVCTCGYLLTSRVRTASVDVIRMQHAFQGMQEQLDQAIPSLAPASWARLFEFVASAENRMESQKTGLPRDMHRISVLITINQKLGHLLDRWPIHFHEWLTEIQASAPPSISLRRTFGKVYRWLYVDLGGEEFQFLRDGFEAYLREHWVGLICQRNRRQPALVAQPGCVSLRQASGRLGIPPTVLKQLHFAGWLDAHVVHLPSGRQAWSIPEAQLVKVSQTIAQGMPLRAVAKYLGIARARVRELVDANLLNPQLKPGQYGAAAWRFAMPDLATLVASCVSDPGRSTDGTTYVPLRTVLKTWRLENGMCGDLLKAIQRREVICISPANGPSGIGGLLADSTSLRQWCQQWRQARSCRYSVDAAAQLLGVKQQVAYHLVRTGRLASEQEGGTGRYWVTSEAIDHFLVEYVSLVELAHQRRTSPTALLNTLPDAPVIGPKIDGCRQYFCRRQHYDS